MSTSPAKRFVDVYDQAVIYLSDLLIGGSFVDKLVRERLLPSDVVDKLRRQIKAETPEDAARQLLDIVIKSEEKISTFLDALKQFDGGRDLLKLLGEASPLPVLPSAVSQSATSRESTALGVSLNSSGHVDSVSQQTSVGQSLLGIISTRKPLPAEVALMPSATKDIWVFIEDSRKLKKIYKKRKQIFLNYVRLIANPIQGDVNVITIFVPNLKYREKSAVTSVFVEQSCSVMLRLPKTTVELFVKEQEKFRHYISDLLKVTCDQIVTTEGSCKVNFTVPGEGLIELVCSLSNPNNFTYLLELDSLAEIQIPGLEPFPLALLTRTTFAVSERTGRSL